jgi:hypothetical protein
MKFQFTGSFQKVLWQGEQSILCLFKPKEGKSDFAIFCKQMPELEKTYELEGYIGKSTSKKFKNDQGRFAQEYSFNAESIKEVDEFFGF